MKQTHLHMQNMSSKTALNYTHHKITDVN